jgi:hypothetical protein
MDKSALLEEIHLSVFQNELEKTAMAVSHGMKVATFKALFLPRKFRKL